MGGGGEQLIAIIFCCGIIINLYQLMSETNSSLELWYTLIWLKIGWFAKWL